MSRTPDRGEIDFDNDCICAPTLISTVNVFAEKLKSIHNPYTGNKRKLLVSLFDIIDKADWKYGTFLDVFSGSGMVGACARHLGKKVIANDLSPFAWYNARYFLEVNETLSKDDIATLTDNSVHCGDFIQTRYADRFSPDEALWLDRFIFNLKQLKDEDKRVLGTLSVLHYVMDRCFLGGRLNKGQVLAELGHRIAHQRNQGQAMSFKDVEWLKPFVCNGVVGPCGKAYNSDAIELLETFEDVIDLAYIDPPYGGQQSDYAQMYAFFNEFILGAAIDEHDSITAHKSRFVEKKTYGQQFDDLLAAARKIPKLVFSYNDSSWCKVGDIVSAIRRFRTRVDVQEVRYDYNYRDKTQPGTEYIILAE